MCHDSECCIVTVNHMPKDTSSNSQMYPNASQLRYMTLKTPVSENRLNLFPVSVTLLYEIPMYTKHLPINQEKHSHLLIYNIMKVWNAQVSFHKRYFVHLFWERPVFDIKPNPDIIFGGWPTLWNKHLLYKETINNLLEIGTKCSYCNMVFTDTNVHITF